MALSTTRDPPAAQPQRSPVDRQGLVPLMDEPLEASNVHIAIGHPEQVTAGLAKEHLAAGTTGPSGF